MLEGKLNRTEAPAWYCAKKTDNFRVLWLSLSEASRPTCLLDELALFYNETTGRCGVVPQAAVLCMSTKLPAREAASGMRGPSCILCGVLHLRLCNVYPPSC